MLECVVNISEGRHDDTVDAIAAAAGADLLDVHRDPHHNRAVLTLVGEEAPRSVTRAAVEALDLGTHRGVHPRIGVVDVVPFVALDGSTHHDALTARDRFGRWIAAQLAVPGFAYGPERSLPEVRRSAFVDLAPTWGPAVPHPTAGAVAVGARAVLVAYNLWLASGDLDEARRVAAVVRGPAVRALGLQVGPRVQVSMNLVAPHEVGPDRAADLVGEHAELAGAELVGLVPTSVLDAVPAERWAALDLSADRTIEARLARRAALLDR